MDDGMNQNNITLTCQQGVFDSFLHIHVSVAYLIYKQENNNSLCKNLSQDTINSLNDRPIPSSYKETLK